MEITVRTNITDLPYSLHDAVVTAVECEEDSVFLRFAEGFFESSEGDCRRVEGFVVLEGVDYDFCNAYVLDFAGNEGKFRGRKMSFEAFAKKYSSLRFEIISETYGYNKSTFSGWLWVKNKPKECILELYHSENMVYAVEGESF